MSFLYSKEVFLKEVLSFVLASAKSLQSPWEGKKKKKNLS